MPDITMNKKAQSILEYILVLGAVSLALTTMGLYLRRGIQSAVKLAADEMGNPAQAMIEQDYRLDWKEKGSSTTGNNSISTENKTVALSGDTSYERHNTSAVTRGSISSRSMAVEKK